MTRLVQTDEPKRRLVHAPAHRQQAMIAQDDSLAVAEGVGNARAFLLAEDDATKVVVDAVAAPEAHGVLRDHVKRLAEDGPGLAIDAVRVAGGVHVRARGVDGRVDGEGGPVDRLLALHHLPRVVDEDEVRHADLREVRRQRVEPEVVGEDGVADGAGLGG